MSKVQEDGKGESFLPYFRDANIEISESKQLLKPLSNNTDVPSNGSVA